MKQRATECTACAALGFPGKKVYAKGLCVRCYARQMWANHPERRAKHIASQRRRKAKPEIAECLRIKDLEYRASHPELRDRKRIKQNERWANDPDYRERQYARQRSLWANDPDYRERKNAYAREWRARQKLKLQLEKESKNEV